MTYICSCGLWHGEGTQEVGDARHEEGEEVMKREKKEAFDSWEKE